jgi:hypothetical protein
MTPYLVYLRMEDKGKASSPVEAPLWCHCGPRSTPRPGPQDVDSPEPWARLHVPTVLSLYHLIYFHRTASLFSLALPVMGAVPIPVVDFQR